MRIRYLVFLLVLEIAVFTAISNPPLDSASEFLRYLASYGTDLVVQSSPTLFLAFGMTVVLMSAGIDLSVGSMTALIACVLGSFTGDASFWWTALPCGLAVALTLGAVNGFVVATLDVPPIVTTLGTMILYRGLCFTVIGDQEVAPFVDVPGYELLAEWGVVALVIGLLFGGGGWLFYRSRWRREILFIGGNRVAARYAGLRVGWRLLAVYLLVGLCAFVAAVLVTARTGSVIGSSLTGLELKVIVAVVLGGTPVEGGRGSLRGAFLGVLVVAVLEEGLRSGALWGEQYLPFKMRYLEYILLGALLLVGVWLTRRGRGAAT